MSGVIAIWYSEISFLVGQGSFYTVDIDGNEKARRYIKRGGKYRKLSLFELHCKVRRAAGRQQ